MKKITLFSTIILLTYTINTPISNATVGGPSYINNIQTDTKGQEIVYEVRSDGGRGCPPEIYSQNLLTGQTKVLLSCSAIEKLSAQDQMTEAELTMSKYPVILKRIDLNKNRITAFSTVIAEQKYDELKGSFGKTDFSLDIFQDSVKKTTFTYEGCKPKQQQIIEGYRIPNSKFMIMVLSTVGDCFEGGYATQRAIVVPEITLYDSTSLAVTMNNIPIPGSGRITLTAKDSTNTSIDGDLTKPDQPKEETGRTTTNDSDTAKDSSSLPALDYQIFIGVLLVIILALIFKKSTR